MSLPTYTRIDTWGIEYTGPVDIGTLPDRSIVALVRKGKTTYSHGRYVVEVAPDASHDIDRSTGQCRACGERAPLLLARECDEATQLAHSILTIDTVNTMRRDR